MCFWVRLTLLDFLVGLPVQRKQPMFFFPFSLRSRLEADKAKNGVPKHEKGVSRSVYEKERERERGS